MRKSISLVAAIALCGASLLAAGCKGGGSTSSGAASGSTGSTAAAVQIDDASRKEAQEIFATRCTVCHGPQGAGNGPASAGLNPRPRNFQDKAWQGTVTDQHIETIVQYGGAAVGKSPAMPPNPDLMARPTVVAGLREKVRSLAH